MWKKYESRPIKRRAHCVTEGDIIAVDSKDSKFNHLFFEEPSEEVPVKFAAFEEVKVGDFIVYLNDDDIYHCNAKVFAEHNIV